VRQSEYIDLIPLGQAVLCENCSQISCGRTDHCIGCGSSATVSLAAILRAAEPVSRSSTPALGSFGLLAVLPGAQRASN
jgi:hypothetical protein